MIALSSTDLAQELDDQIYKIVLHKFGELKEQKRYDKDKTNNTRIQELRKTKKELKKARKIIHKNGQQGSRADALISKEWFATMREHNRLTRASRERETIIRNSQQQKKFKQNPWKFGKELFQKKATTLFPRKSRSTTLPPSTKTSKGTTVSILSPR